MVNIRHFIFVVFLTGLFIFQVPTVRAGDSVPMTLDRMNSLIEAIDGSVVRKSDGYWNLKIDGVPVLVIADAGHDRMSILVGIVKVDKLDPEVYLRLMQANFDSALDGRYAVVRGVLWSAFLHPLGSLNDSQFLKGVGQTVNLACTYGVSYSSGLMNFGGGDSNGIRERELTEKLLEKGNMF